MTDPRAEAERLLRRFAHDTNLLIAGRPVRVHGAGHVADEVTTMARALGARVVGPGEAPDGLLEISLDGTLALDGAPLPRRDSADARIDFAAAHMPVSRAVAAELAASAAVRGLRIGVCLTLEPKTANLALLLDDAGADVAVYAHADETDATVAEALRARGIAVEADALRSLAEERAAALAFVTRGLDVLIDDGSHLIRLAHEEAPDAVAGWIGACEETTSGLAPLRAMQAEGALATPVIAVNDAATKTAFDNRYGTGQSCVFAIADLLDSVGLSVRDQLAVVVGYGPVGQGVAAHLAALGAEVAVVEADPLRALLAMHDGYAVGRLADLAPGALVVSATGTRGTVPADISAAAAAVAVAGGVPAEIAWHGELEPVAPHVDRAGTTLILDRGGCINVTAAEGNPIEIMDLSFATQLAAVRHLVTTGPGVGVHALPDSTVGQVASLAARERGLALDEPRDAFVGPEGWRSRRWEGA